MNYVLKPPDLNKYSNDPGYKKGLFIYFIGMLPVIGFLLMMLTHPDNYKIGIPIIFLTLTLIFYKICNYKDQDKVEYEDNNNKDNNNEDKIIVTLDI